MFFGHFFQHVGTGLKTAAGCLFALQAEFCIQYFADLFGRTEVEFFAGQFINLAFNLSQLFLKARTQFAQGPRVNHNAVLFHLFERAD